MAVTKESFELGEKALDLAVYSQSASRSKALSEIITNGLDAGSDKIEVHITPSTFEVIDFGCGFESEDQIDEYFAQLSFDHNTSKHQAKGYIGTHGVGRMQIQVLAKSAWRTNTFQMSTDLKHKGLSFEKTVGLPFKSGCTVSGEWYTPLTHLEYKTLITELSSAFQFCNLPIFINGIAVNQPISRAPDIETNNFSFWHDPKMKNTVITNCGIYVCHSYFMATGIAVSKKAMKLNTARTQAIESECLVWQDMKCQLRDFAINALVDKVLSNKRLNATERKELYRNLESGNINIMKLANKAIVPIVKGKPMSTNNILLSELPVIVNTYSNPSREHIDLHQQEKIIFIDLSDMYAWAQTRATYQNALRMFGLGDIPFEVAPRGTRHVESDDYQRVFKKIELSKLSPRNKIALAALESVFKSFVDEASINLKHIKIIPCRNEFNVGYGGVSTNGDDEVYVNISSFLSNSSISPNSISKTFYRVVMMAIYDQDFVAEVQDASEYHPTPNFTTEHYHTFAHLIMEQAGEIGAYVESAVHAALGQLKAQKIKLKRDEGRVFDPLHDYAIVVQKLDETH